MGRHRIESFVAALSAAGVDAAVVSHPVDLYYLAGTSQQSTLVIPVEGEPTLLVRRNLEGARQESWVADIRASLSSADVTRALVERGCHCGIIGVVGDVLPASGYVRLKESLPQARMVDVSMTLRRVRMIKEDEEIRRVREAARIADAGHRAASECLRPGVSELQVATEIELEMVRAGGDDLVLPRNMCIASRVVSVVSAASAYTLGGLDVTVCGRGSTPVVQWGPSKRTLEAGDAVVVDLCGSFDGYLSDHSRTYVLGKPSRDQERMAQALRSIVEGCLDYLVPGQRARDVYAAVHQAAAEAGYGDFIMGPRERNIRFVGHGVGLELDELPVLFPGDDTVLAAGMVIAFEPILLIPDVAVAAMENTVLITRDGHEVLNRTPMEMVELR